ncbi:hypothetical protein [Haloglycomyces albus]|uniref:hypothetical protein n=1 Tax=Haloglycomyces albus TaxID=526067 RepID=UPI00046CDAEC|nr:hypothetical protein [Haloglycomyces albus]
MTARNEPASAVDRLIRISGALVASAAAALAALVEVFLVPLRFGATQVPLAAATAFLLNWGLAALIVWWTRRPWSVVLPVGIWFAVAVTATMPTTSGSILVLATLNGYLFLLAGTAGGAVAIFTYLRPKYLLKEKR